VKCVIAAEKLSVEIVKKTLLSPAAKRRLHAMLYHSVCLYIRLFVCRQRVLVGHWHDWISSAIVLAAVRGRSTAGPVRSVPDLLMAAGNYRIGSSSYNDLFYCCCCLY